jgi:hypothetical protein
MAKYYAPVDRPTLELEDDGGVVIPGTIVNLNAEQVKANKEKIDNGDLVDMSKIGEAKVKIDENMEEGGE